MSNDNNPKPEGGVAPEASKGAEAAQRARAEAEERRAAQEAQKIEGEALPPEQGGRKGPEPIRYGDWEVKGLATDF